MRKPFTLLMHLYTFITFEIPKNEIWSPPAVLQNLTKHLIPKNEIPKNEIWSTPLKVEAFVKSQDQLKREGCLVIIFGPRNDTRSTTVGVHLVKKRTRWQRCSWTCSNFALLCITYVYHKNNVQKNKSPYSSFIPIFFFSGLIVSFLISPFDYLDYCLILLPNRRFFKLGPTWPQWDELRRGSESYSAVWKWTAKILRCWRNPLGKKNVLLPGNLSARPRILAEHQEEKIVFQPSFFRAKLAVKLWGCRLFSLT